jgi:8-oxo-dGTP pyrophosphatase MutT (NUDIX family)
MSEQKIIRKVGLAVIQDRKVLLARSAKNTDAFYTLGGKIEPGENDIDCIVREVAEEASTTVDADSLQFLAEFQNLAHGKTDTFVNIRLYKGKLMGEPVPSAEVAELKYFDSTIDQKHLTPISEDIINFLKHEQYID